MFLFYVIPSLLPALSMDPFVSVAMRRFIAASAFFFFFVFFVLLLCPFFIVPTDF